MGAGKSTFARFLIEALGADRPSEGSPTFALAHEYRSPRGEIIHLDLYRLRAESEIDDAGIPDYFWSRPALVICEWLSLWPEFESRVVGASPGRRNFRVQITIDDADHRSVRISCGG